MAVLTIAGLPTTCCKIAQNRTQKEPMTGNMFVHLDSKQVSNLIQGAKHRVIYCAPGLQQPVAAAVVNTRAFLGRDSVRVILDVDDSTARMGYGDFDAISLLTEGDVDVRVESGLRTCVLICDAQGFAFFAPSMLVELQDDAHVGVNALVMHPEQVHNVVDSLLPPPPSGAQPRFPPEIGREVLTNKQMDQVKAALDANPPQKFDLARKVNVFNAFVEFVEMRLTGLHIGRHTVQLPRDLVLALKDDTTAKRLLTTFRLVSEDSKVAKEAAEIDHKVRALRERLTRSLGDGLGSVILRAKRREFAECVASIQADIAVFQQKVAERLEKELEASRKKLVEGLLPAVKKAPPEALKAQLSTKPTADILRRYLDDELRRVFPEAKSLIGEMKLEWIPKGVTYETLNNMDFQKRVRDAFPYENWDKPFREFEAAPASPQNFQLFPSDVKQ